MSTYTTRPLSDRTWLAAWHAVEELASALAGGER